MRMLIIAEKPSVAGDIAKALGGFKRVESVGYERADIVITHAIGHLVGIDAPEGSPRGVPCIPEQFALVPSPKTASQLRQVVRLIASRDIDTLINACDAGREGELIFRRIVAYAGAPAASKTIKRMWLQSMTAQAIRDGFAHLRSDQEMRGLSDAAFARAEADWIVGINGSRITRRMSGGSAPVGRVMTPTLMILVNREEAISSFVARPFWEIHASIRLAGGSYVAKWTSGQPGSAENPADRFWDKDSATRMLARCQGQDPSSITDNTKPSRNSPPLLFDLTLLQREANRLFGFSASDTLAIAQALYEKQKALTYPRTDAKALPEDYLPTVRQTVAALGTQGYESLVQPIEAGNWIKPTKRIFDNSKISDHFAIIPTGKAPVDLSAKEQKIYDLVVRRFLAVFYPDAEYLVTVRTAVIGSESFVAGGRVLTVQGWLAVYQDDDKDADTPTLPRLAAGETGKTESMKLHQGKTKAPSRFTEASLLSAMENAGKDVDDEALRDAMSERGLGTPATRAATIEKLIDDAYVTREKKFLVPTRKAFDLKGWLSSINTPELLSPELTGAWEYKLKQVELGRLAAAEFMDGIKRFTVQMAERAATVPDTTHSSGSSVAQADPAHQVLCPTCKKAMRRITGSKGVFWGCTGYADGCKTTLPDVDGKPGTPRAASGSTTTDSIRVTPSTAVTHYPCPACHEGHLKQRTGPRGAFWGCSRYPSCTHTRPDDQGKPGVRLDSIQTRATPDDRHRAAMSAPRERTAKDGDVGGACPECSKGVLTLKHMRGDGKEFIGCSAYPQCRYFRWPAANGAGTTTQH